MFTKYNFAIVAVLLIAFSQQSFADEVLDNSKDPKRGQSVSERPHPGYDSIGKKISSFTVKPSITLERYTNDNIFAAHQNEISDEITIAKPAINVDSDWNNHSLGFFANGSFAQYDDQKGEDYSDFSVGSNLRLDILRKTSISAKVAYDQLHEDRGSPDDTVSLKPGKYNTVSGGVGFERSLRRFAFSITGDVKDYDYNDTSNRAGTITNNDDRDRMESDSTLRLGYKVLPDYEAFIRTSYKTRDYDDAIDDNGKDRDSFGYDVVGGTAIDLGGITTGEVFLGYQRRNYDDRTLRTIQGITYGGNLLWNVTEMTSISPFISRTIAETTQDNASGSIATTYGISIEHELLRNVLLSGYYNFTNNEYDGGTLDRTDNSIDTGGRVTYFLNRYLTVNGSYKYNNRDSSVANSDYTANVYMLSLGLGL